MEDGKSKSRIQYQIYEIEQKNQETMDLSLFQEVGGIIEKNYGKYNGFVIIAQQLIIVHLACALSFMFDHLGKSVVITTSKFPYT